MVINNFVSEIVSEFANRMLFTDYSNTPFSYTVMLFSDSKVSKLVGENLWELWQTSWTSLLCGLRLLAQVASQQLIIAARQKSEQEIASHDSFSEMKLLFGKFDKRCLLNSVHERFLLRLFEQIEFFSEQFSLYCVNQSIRKLKRSLPEGDPSLQSPLLMVDLQNFCAEDSSIWLIQSLNFKRFAFKILRKGNETVRWKLL